ncbi:MAG: PEP-CTERM sorting domain-containing protein [Rubrivivax sp.]|nr:PEP-CTERM sorting domain-containing protein [Rubrivivax sp.]
MQTAHVPRSHPAGSAQPWRRLLRHLAPLAAAVLALNAAAQNTNTVMASSNAGQVFDFTATGLPVQAGNAAPIDMATWGGGESQFAAASGLHLTLRAVAATRGDGNQMQTVSSFNWSSPVLPTGAAPVGTPVTVTVSFHLDGSSAAGYGAAFNSGGGVIALPVDFQLSSWVGTQLRLDVYDLDSPDYEPGAPTARVSFAAGVSVESAIYPPSASYPSGAQYTTIGHNADMQLTDPIAGSTTWAGGSSYNQAYADAFPARHVHDVDTGWLSLSFETVVGNRIGFEGELVASLYCSTYSSTTSSPSCAGLSDYGSTFDAELSTNLPGVGFGDHQPGTLPTVVPEPATWALMFVGVAALLRRVRGQAMADVGAGR